MTEVMHMTHISHISSIIAQGGVQCDRQAADQGLSKVSIAYAILKERRAATPVPVARGGTLADYVPHYFAPRSPMLYAIDRGLVADYKGGQREIVYLIASAERVERSGIPFAFTDGHAVMAMTEFYDDLADLNAIDWPLMAERYWSDTLEDNDRKRRRQAEFLVHSFLPWELIERIVVKDTEARRQLLTALEASPHQPPVEVDPGYYF